MSAHLQLLDRADGEGRSLFMLTEPYPYRLGPGCTIIVPRGYKTNFGTIPRWFSWIVSPTQLREAAIVHDWLCNESFDGDEVTVKSGFSRWMADAVLYEAMARLGFGWFKRSLVFGAVRLYAIVTYQHVWPEQPEEITIE